MVQIIKNPYSDIGRNVASGLSNLANYKLGEMQQRQAAHGIRTLLPNLTSEQASSFSYLSPEIQQLYVKNALEAPQNQAYAQALGLFNQTPENSLMAEQAPAVQQQQGVRNPFEYASEPVVDLQNTAQKEITKQPLPALNAKQATEFAKLKQKEKAADRADVASKFKATQEERTKISDKARAAKTRLHDLERFEELEGKGEGVLNTPGYVEFLKRSGLDIPALGTPESEEFSKIAANFIGGAKEAFGGRVSNFEVEQFLKTIPSLSQSPEGRKRVISNLKRLYRGDVAYNDTKKEIIKENKGIPPYDLADQIDDRIDSRLDKISDQFREDLKRPVPKGQNKFITALQAGAGSAVSGVPSALKGAAKGAALGAGIGRLGGGPGTAAGAGLGALGGLFGLI
jgi:hypothetical protein